MLLVQYDKHVIINALTHKQCEHVSGDTKERLVVIAEGQEAFITIVLTRTHDG